jgi:peptidylprolyl isomerase
VRRLLALLFSSLVLVVAAGCGSSSDSSDSSGSPKPKTASLDSVKVTGAPDEKPKVGFQKPFSVTTTQSKVLRDGDGPTLKEGQQIVVDYVGINGRDQSEFDSSWQRGEPAAFSLKRGQLIDGFVTGLVGKSVGDRVLLAIPPEDGYGEQGNPQAGIEGTDTLLFVIDVRDAYTPLSKAEGEQVTPPEGLPTVDVDEKGIPSSVKVPKTDAPKELVAAPLIRGEGAKVTADSTVTLHYTAVNWRTGKEFDSTWKRGAFITLPLRQTPVKGLSEGLVDQTVGSRVLLVLPPDKGLGQDIPEADLKKTDTLVFVVDILHARQADAG